MATPPRFFEDHVYYHVYNRGNSKQQIFLNDRDYERFLKKVTEYKVQYPVSILAYCLMPNHFHFLLQQLSSNSISKFISNLCNTYILARSAPVIIHQLVNTLVIFRKVS